MRAIRIVVAALALAIAGCGTPGTEIYVVDKPIPAAVQPAGAYQIEAFINEAITAKGWKADKVRPGELRATQEWDNKTAVVTIFYSQQRYSIRLHSSLNLDERNGTINNQYNIRVRALEAEIDRRMKPAT